MTKIMTQPQKQPQTQKTEPVLVLGSSSAARLRLIKNLGYEPQISLAPDINEEPLKGETPMALCKRLALQKGLEVCKTLATHGKINPKANLLNHSLTFEDIKNNGAVVVSGDTVAAAGRRVLEKTYDKDECRRYLNLISGRNHRVYTTIFVGYLIFNNQSSELEIKNHTCKIVETRLKFKRLTPQEIESFLSTNQWQGNAGGYTIGGYAERFVISINGSYSSVIGLPSYQADCLLSRYFCNKNCN
jgi:septum formation protein